MFRIVASTSAALAAAMLPVFLLGALTGELSQDLGFSEAEVGAAMTILFIVAGTAATPAGRLTERIGAAWSLRIGVALAAAVTALVGAWATNWWQLAIPLATVGVAIGLVDTGAARAYSDQLTAAEQGRAFGLKEASVPTASLLAGLAVPAMAAPHGWRWTFLTTVAIAALVLVSLWRLGGRRGEPRSAGREVERREPPSDAKTTSVTGPTIWLAAGVGLGAGAATAAAAFMVPALSDRGMTTSGAGFALSAASMASIAVRVVSGLWADRPSARPVGAVVVLCLIGSAAAAVLALPVAPLAVVGAAVVLLGAGWGWTGLAFLTAVRANPGAPAAAAGVVLTGLALGGALGPIAFGVLAARLSYTGAWIATAIALGVAAVTAFATRGAFRRP